MKVNWQHTGTVQQQRRWLQQHVPAEDESRRQHTTMSAMNSVNNRTQPEPPSPFIAPATPPATPHKQGLFASIPHVLLGHRTSNYGDIVTSPIKLQDR